MKLHGYFSFNPVKVQLALAELGLDYEHHFVKLHKREHLSDEITALNPNQLVQILEDDGLVIWESNAILCHLGEREGRLWPSDPAGRAAAFQWLFYEAPTVSAHAGPLWYIDVVGPRIGLERDEARYARARKGTEKALRILDDHLQSHDWMLGSEFSLVDCAYAPVLDALGLSRFNVLQYPAITAWMKCVRERPSWALRNGPEARS